MAPPKGIEKKQRKKKRKSRTLGKPQQYLGGDSTDFYVVETSSSESDSDAPQQSTQTRTNGVVKSVRIMHVSMKYGD